MIHVKGLDLQNPLNLRISGVKYRKLLRGENVNLTSPEFKELKRLGVILKPNKKRS